MVYNEPAEASGHELNQAFQTSLCGEFLELLSVSCLRIYLKVFTASCPLLIRCEKPKNHGPKPARLITSLSCLSDAQL